MELKRFARGLLGRNHFRDVTSLTCQTMRSQPMPKGVLYVAVGRKYLSQAEASIRSLLEHHHDMPIDILASEEEVSLGGMFYQFPNVNLVDCTNSLKRLELDLSNKHLVSRALKVNSVALSRFGKTLFLDTDTYIRHPLSEIFEFLDENDLVVTGEAVASYSYDKKSRRPRAERLRSISSKTTFNSGVFAFTSALRSNGFSDAWMNTWLNQTHNTDLHEWSRLSDQKAFNAVIKNLEYRVKILDNAIWNAQCRVLRELIENHRWDDIRIIHCKLVHRYGCDPDRLLRDPYINKFTLQA